MRESAVAGLFYEAGPSLLRKQIRACFLGSRGPGVLPSKKHSGNILGAIVPHAGYAYSGMCAAWAYKEIAEAEQPQTAIILGTAHYGLGSGILLDDWKTPLGIVRTDVELSREILMGGEISQNTPAHLREHSVEVQLPFLQFINRRIRIVGIVVGEDINYKKAGQDIKSAVETLGRNVIVIASSDFTHYGPDYGYIPFFDNIKERQRELDLKAIELIMKSDDEGFLGYVTRTGATICGARAIALLLRTIQFKKAQLLNYYTSGELTGYYKNSVGYASMIFR